MNLNDKSVKIAGKTYICFSVKSFPMNIIFIYLLQH